MASPQTENGYTKVANELLQAVYRFPLSGQELRVVLWILRSIYGWKGRRETPPTSVRALAAAVGLPVATAGWALRGLEVRGVLLRPGGGVLRLNKNYDEWLRRRPQQLRLTARPTAGHQPAAAAPAPAAPPQAQCGNPHPEGFQKPTIEDVRAYCAQRKNVVDPEKFFHHYESNGWAMGRAPMTNWKSAVCYWERTTFAASAYSAASSGKLCPICEKAPITSPRAVVCGACARCKKCNEQTADLVIGRRPDGTKTAWCRNCRNKKSKEN